MAQNSNAKIAAAADVPMALMEEEIRLLAYFNWQSRGCPEGSPEEDWLRAEELLAASGGSMRLQPKGRSAAA